MRRSRPSLRKLYRGFDAIKTSSDEHQALARVSVSLGAVDVTPLGRIGPRGRPDGDRRRISARRRPKLTRRITPGALTMTQARRRAQNATPPRVRTLAPAKGA
jgi:hypothetical protein